jgi:hypothetical protein
MPQTMIQFLKETLQLLWYAFFQPSRLQARLNACVPQQSQDGKQKPTKFAGILTHCHTKKAKRLLAQFSLLWFITLAPLIWAVSQADWENGYTAVLLIVTLPFIVVGCAGLNGYALSFVAPVLVTLPVFLSAIMPALNKTFANPNLTALLWRGSLAVLVGTTLGGWGGLAGQQQAKGMRQVSAIMTSLVAFGVAVMVVGNVSILGASMVAFLVAVVAGVGVANKADAGLVATSVAFGVMLVVTLGVTAVVTSGAMRIVAFVVTMGIAGMMAVGMSDVVAMLVASVAGDKITVATSDIITAAITSLVAILVAVMTTVVMVVGMPTIVPIVVAIVVVGYVG